VKGRKLSTKFHSSNSNKPIDGFLTLIFRMRCGFLLFLLLPFFGKAQSNGNQAFKTDSDALVQFDFALRGALLHPLLFSNTSADLKPAKLGFAGGLSIDAYWGHFGFASGLSLCRKAVVLQENRKEAMGYVVQNTFSYSTFEIPLCFSYRTIDSLHAHGWKFNIGPVFEHSELRNSHPKLGEAFGSNDVYSDSLQRGSKPMFSLMAECLKGFKFKNGNVLEAGFGFHFPLSSQRGFTSNLNYEGIETARRFDPKLGYVSFELRYRLVSFRDLPNEPEPEPVSPKPESNQSLLGR